MLFTKWYFYKTKDGKTYMYKPDQPFAMRYYTEEELFELTCRQYYEELIESVRKDLSNKELL